MAPKLWPTTSRLAPAQGSNRATRSSSLCSYTCMGCAERLGRSPAGPSTMVEKSGAALGISRSGKMVRLRVMPGSRRAHHASSRETMKGLPPSLTVLG